MNSKKMISILVLSLPLLGSKCKQEDPLPPDISGDWKWTCTVGPTESEVAPLLATCAEQVGTDSPFLEYVKEYIQFQKQPQDWTALFEFGTCVDSQKGTYVQNKDDLNIYDSAGNLAQTYKVKKVSDTELELSQAGRKCNLVKSQLPTVLVGMHPRPLPTRMEWDLRIEGAISFWTSQLQVPFVYQTPQIQVVVPNNSPYRVGYSLLSHSADGSELADYAIVVQFYDKASGALISKTIAEVIDGQVQHSFTGPSGEQVQLNMLLVQ